MEVEEGWVEMGREIGVEEAGTFRVFVYSYSIKGRRRRWQVGNQQLSI